MEGERRIPTLGPAFSSLNDDRDRVATLVSRRADEEPMKPEAVAFLERFRKGGRKETIEDRIGDQPPVILGSGTAKAEDQETVDGLIGLDDEG